MFNKVFFFIICCLAFSLEAFEVSSYKIKALFNSLDPKSVAQHLAFYELYPATPEGYQAFQIACELMCGVNIQSGEINISSLGQAIGALVALVNKQSNESALQLTQSELDIINMMSQSLANRKLKGYYAQSESEVLSLDTHEIDLARGLFLSQLGNDRDSLFLLKSYEAAIDLMALQIQARLPNNSPPATIIRTMNEFIFTEMGFRFPPHSLYAKDVDLYTFLPSVLDSRRGVCLGVSIVYLCLAQRLNLSLEMITPPGHIYIRYNNGKNDVINIETTARGIDLDSEDYLGIDTLALQQRTIKEVIGLAHFNQAAVFLKQENFRKALDCYQKAKPYIPEDMLLKELMAYCHLLIGEIKQGEQLLKEVVHHVPDYALSPSSVAEDYLNGVVEPIAFKAVFMFVDEKRESILSKQRFLQDIVHKFPRFRTGIFALATTWMQLHRFGEALEALKIYHQLDPNDSKVEYYLAALYAERYNYPQAWAHLKRAEQLTESHSYFPKALRDLRRELSSQCPE